MQSKFTQNFWRRCCIRLLATACILVTFFQSQSQVLFNEGFDVAVPLPAGWASQNLSAPLGVTGWSQGAATVFNSNSGAPTSYISANYNNTGDNGTISNWLFSPSVTLKDGDIFTFYTRDPGSGFADRLQVRLSANGTSTNVGATATSVGDFTGLLLDINPTYDPFGYPSTWTQYTVTVTGLAGVPTPGRIALRYFVEDAGLFGNNSDYIGIDDVVYTSFTGPCTGTPAPGNTLSSAASVCPATNFTLSVQNNPFVTGLTYQWQSSATGLAGSFTNIAGATSQTLVRQQNAATYYQLVVTCGANSGNSTPLQVTMNPPTSCYCVAGSTDILFEKIGNVTLNTINNNSTSTAGYENFTAISTTLQPGQPYTMSVAIAGAFTPDQVIAWIDYNHNGLFTDAGETLFTSATGLGPHSATIIVPFSALPGPTRMRVRLHDTSLGANATPCGNSSYGQVEDYTVDILPVVPCAGAPNPGNTTSTVSTVCAGTSFTLGLQNFTSGSGVTYQWQSSATGAAGSFTNITGATGVQYSATLTANTYYQAIVTCGAASTTSTPLQVLLTPFTNCYCTSVAASAADEDIFNITIGALNNASSCTTVGPGPGSIMRRYANYRSGTGAPVPVNVIQGANNPISITVGTCGGNFTNSVAAWIDFNHDGTFGTTERVYVSPGGTVGPHVETGNAVISTTALLGVTGMRVISSETGTPGSIQPCAAYNWGETEDYLVNIVPCVQGVITAQPVSTTVGCSGNASFTVGATGSLLSYNWEYRTSPTGPWLSVPNAAPYSGLGSATLAITNIPSTFNGYQYRAVLSGACTSPDPTNTATLTVGPLVAIVNPTSANICAGTLQALSLPPSSSQFCSGTIDLRIPDLNGPPATTAAQADAGVNHSIAVTIPTGAVVTAVNVKLNITHPYNGDLVIVLKAPNGRILNLDYHKSGLGSSGVNFTNTIISSAGTAAIGSGASPYTGTFRADASIGAGLFGDPSGSGPTGFQPDVTTWAPMYSVPNGNWTIALQDPSPWAGDQGVLNNWCIELTYGVPSTGVFTGPAGTIFTNAAGTIPYTGTPISTVYVNPASTSTYSVVVSNPLCTSAPFAIPITVSNTLSGVTVRNRDSVCVGGTKSLTVSATAGNIQTTQWQVSTDGGVTWTNITNGGIYNNATTSTLTITGATAANNNYRYRAIVSNACNTVTSSADILTVNPTPVVTLSANPYTKLLPGMFTTLTATSGPSPAQTYSWTMNGLPVTNINNSLVVNVDGLGDYAVTVTDIYGCTGTSNILNISDSSSSIVFIYPSPNTGQFQIRYYSAPGNILPRMVNIYDAKGARIYSRSYPIGAPYERMDVDLRNHGKGIYMVELADRLGTRIKAGRVIVL
jgi:subtilisin-like proprotein convertase family protein